VAGKADQCRSVLRWQARSIGDLVVVKERVLEGLIA
jgi:hypothetical protein